MIAAAGITQISRRRHATRRGPVRPLREAVAAGAVGLLVAAYGLGVHLADAALSGPSLENVVGSALGVGGLVLVGLGYVRALRGRGWPARVVALILTMGLLQWFVLPAVTGALVSNAYQGPVDGAETLGLAEAHDVRFAARDGVSLAGWMVPGRNGAAVVVLHGSHGTREATVEHVRALAGMGYSVLSFDARGHGESGGAPNAAGWTGASDVAGAVAFLRSQPRVDRHRIGGLGLSMGGEELLRAAGEGVRLAGVVADGAGASTMGDQRLLSSAAIPSSVTWLSMRAAELYTGDREPESLHSVVGAIGAPVLLIASNAADERRIDEEFRRRIGEQASLWYVADAGHTQARDRHPAAYDARVAGFLRSALGG